MKNEDKKTVEKKCICSAEHKKIGLPKIAVMEKVPPRLHLRWCPKSTESKKYRKLPWWKKLLKDNPEKTYEGF